VAETIFYSWQSDIPPNRNLVGSALAAAIKELNKDSLLRVEARKDQSLDGSAGAIPIPDDIFQRIDASSAFLGDVTLVTTPDAKGRRSPNPSVLIEIGHAHKHYGWERMILAFNAHYGDHRDLPFDLDKNRLLLFDYDPNAADEARAAWKNGLVNDLKRAVERILGLPTVKDKVREFLNATSPEILRRVRAGEQQLVVNIAEERLPELKALMSYVGIDDVVQFANHYSYLGNATCSNGGINDRQAIGALRGWVLTFKREPASW